MQKIFDGHNDLLLRLWMENDIHADLFFVGGNSKNEKTLQVCKNFGIKKGGHIDISRANIGGFIGGFFSIFVPNNNYNGNSLKLYNFKLDQKYAFQSTLEMLEIILNMEKKHPNKFKIIRSKNDIQKFSITDNKIFAVIHIEGAEAIGEDLSQLNLLYELGLRSIGPVWSRSNIFGNGVPFDFPNKPDIGEGLSRIGKNLIKKCNDLGIIIDLSHLNEAGFWDVEKLSSKPLVATHSNVHKLCESPRNLTDNQLNAIAESKGMVGLNFATGFLRSDGKKDSDTNGDVLIRHLDYLLEKLGENGVGIGSDFDGALIPNFIGDCSGLQKLIKLMEGNGYNKDLIEKICYKNWIRILSQTFK